MKKYNRITRKYEEVSTEKVPVLKKNELCRGNKPHKMELCMPQYGGYDNLDLDEETIVKYYESEDRLYLVQKTEHGFQESLGITQRYFFKREPHRYIRCSVCGKRE